MAAGMCLVGTCYECHEHLMPLLRLAGYTELNVDWALKDMGIERPDERVLARQALYKVDLLS